MGVISCIAPAVQHPPLLHSWASLDSGVDMPVVELPVEVEEDGVIIDVRSNFLSLGPRGGLESLLEMNVKRTFRDLP